jgi:rare lipoprotein A
LKARALALAAVLLGGLAFAAGTYRVRAGDSLWTVARAHGTTVTALQRANPGVRARALRVGQRLHLPGHTPAARGATSAALQRGHAVYYGGRPNRHTRMTAAHRTLPLGSWVRVTQVGTGRSVDVLINDRGPFGNPARVIDLSRPAAASLGMLARGTVPVTVRVLSRP